VEANALEESKALGRGVAARAKGREGKARGGEGTHEGAAWAGRDPTVQAGRQGSETPSRASGQALQVMDGNWHVQYQPHVLLKQHSYGRQPHYINKKGIS
jgi:hypothetical protein